MIGGNLLGWLATTDRLHGKSGHELRTVGAEFAHGWCLQIDQRLFGDGNSLRKDTLLALDRQVMVETVIGQKSGHLDIQETHVAYKIVKTKSGSELK